MQRVSSQSSINCDFVSFLQLMEALKSTEGPAGPMYDTHLVVSGLYVVTLINNAKEWACSYP